MKKKLLSCLMAGVLAVQGFGGGVSAAGASKFSAAFNQKPAFRTETAEMPLTAAFTDQNTVQAENGALIQADQITAAAGEQVEVPIRMQGNPGITALSLNISYDNTKLKLLGASDGAILGTSSFISGKDLSAIPYTLNWDDLAKENNTENGIVAKLRFAVLDGAAGSSPVKVELNQKSTYNVDMEEVAFAVKDGSVTISGQAPKTTASVPATTVTSTTTAVTTLSSTTTAAATTTAKPTAASVTTVTTAATAASSGDAVTTLNTDEPAILVDHVAAQRSENVSVPIRIRNNPGIAGLSLNVIYDDTKLMLLGAADGKILGSATFLSGKDISANPYTLNWDDLSKTDNTGNGVVATLVFMVLDDAEEGYAKVNIEVNQKSTYNVKMQEVAFQVVGGSVNIYDPSTGTKPPFVTTAAVNTAPTKKTNVTGTTAKTTSATYKTTASTAKTTTAISAATSASTVKTTTAVTAATSASTVKTTTAVTAATSASTVKTTTAVSAATSASTVKTTTAVSAATSASTVKTTTAVTALTSASAAKSTTTVTATSKTATGPLITMETVTDTKPTTAATGSTTTAEKQVTTVSIPANAAAILADTVKANSGDTVTVNLKMQNNPGIAALSLNISYDNTKLKLLGAADGKILGTSAFLSGNDLTLIPYTLNWDDLADENNTGNGVVATLQFEVLAGADGTAVIEVALNQKSTFNVDLKEVKFYTGNGAVEIGSSGATGTTATTLSESSATETTTETETTTQPVGPAIIGGTVSAKKGDTVELPIRLYNNPGITALSLNVSYDPAKLKLLGAADGKILGTSTFLSGNDLTLIPYTLNWDDLSTENNTGNGIVAKLRFEVLAEEGQALVEIALNQKSTFNVDLEEVAFATGSGKVKIGKADASEFLLGDVNLDGSVGVEDAQLTLTAYVNIMADMDSGLTDLQKKAADINADGQISVEDAQNILLYYVSNTLAGTTLTWAELLGG